MNPIEQRRRMLADALAQTGGDLLDAIPSNGNSLDPKGPKEARMPLSSAPRPKEIDYMRTTDDMIINGAADLKGRRKVIWKN